MGAFTRFFTSIFILMAFINNPAVAKINDIDLLNRNLDNDLIAVIYFSDQPSVLNGKARGDLFGNYAIQFATPGGLVENEFNSLNAIAVEAKGETLSAIRSQDNIEEIWILPNQVAITYIRIMKSIERHMQLPPPSVVNISISPSADTMPLYGNLDEPMSRITKISAEKGHIPVLAAGNYYADVFGEDNKGFISPWGYPPWVICVAAVDETGIEIYSRSARGEPNDPLTWPDVSGDGIDVIGPYPTYLEKSQSRKERDETSDKFTNRIPKKDWDIYTLESGTSQATGHVSGALAQVLHFLQKTEESGHDIFYVEYTAEQLERVKRLTHKRLIGEISEIDNGYVIHYPTKPYWAIAKQLLIDTSIEIPNAKGFETGAGFVNKSNINANFGIFGLVDIKIQPHEVYRKKSKIER